MSNREIIRWKYLHWRFIDVRLYLVANYACVLWYTGTRISEGSGTVSRTSCMHLLGPAVEVNSIEIADKPQRCLIKGCLNTCTPGLVIFKHQLRSFNSVGSLVM
jgi:hypothetical protein